MIYLRLQYVIDFWLYFHFEIMQKFIFYNVNTKNKAMMKKAFKYREAQEKHWYTFSKAFLFFFN